MSTRRSIQMLGFLTLLLAVPALGADASDDATARAENAAVRAEAAAARSEDAARRVENAAERLERMVERLERSRGGAEPSERRR
jgi:hypothetical protein